MGGTFRTGNSFFLALLALGLLAGCATTPEQQRAKEEKQDLSVFRLHREVREEGLGAKTVELPRRNPMKVAIEKEAFLDERDVIRADVIEVPGGFAIRVECTSHGRMALEMATVTRVGQRILAYGQWTAGEKETVSRWLAAPLVKRASREGILVFTPDCDREEAVRFVRGLNNVAVKLKNQPKPKKSEAKEADKDKDKADPSSSAEEAIKVFEEAR